MLSDKPGLAAQTMEIDEAVGGGGQLIDFPEDADEPNHMGYSYKSSFSQDEKPDDEPDAADDLEGLAGDIREADGGGFQLDPHEKDNGRH